MSEIGINGVKPTNSVETIAKTVAKSADSVVLSRPQMTELSRVSFGRDLIRTPIVLKAGDSFDGKSLMCKQ